MPQNYNLHLYLTLNPELNQASKSPSDTQRNDSTVRRNERKAFGI